MKLVTITCDRCGKVIESGAQSIRISWGESRSNYDFQRLDLCEACSDKLRTWGKAADDASLPTR